MSLAILRNARHFLVAVAILLFVVLASCSINKYAVAAGLPKPDEALQTGTVYGYDLYIWECYQGKRIVVYRYSSEMTASSYTREEASCGETTPIEKKLETETKRERNPDTFW